MKNLLLFIILSIFTIGKSYSQCAGLDFSADLTNGCVPSSIKFTALGYASGSTFSWDFGSGYTTASAADSVKFQLYKSTGVFSVSLKITTNGKTCTINKNNYITISTAPTIKVSWDKSFICNPNIPITFTDSSTGLTQRDWIIDGNTVKNYASTITFKFTTPGAKQLTMKVKSSLGCIATYNKDTAVMVMDDPVITIDSTATIGCMVLQVPFKVDFVSTFQTIQSYHWDFVGGTPDTSNSANPNVSYNSLGDYNVKLKIKTNQGCTYTVNKNKFVKVIQKPILDFTANDSIFCDSNDIFLTNTSTNTNGFGSYSWILPNSSLYNPKYIDSSQIKLNILTDGKYDIGLKYTFNNCTTDTIKKAYFNIHKTIANIKLDEKYFCQVPATINFKDSGSYIDNGYQYTCRWKIKSQGGTVLYTDTSHSFSYQCFQNTKTWKIDREGHSIYQRGMDLLR
ncbi:MAG: hypothetical protein HYZ42_03405 [Bacteroidetes bacterium]|nr:hypothetical protein [Bacteroidota bacterium]